MRITSLLNVFLVLAITLPQTAFSDGKVVPPRNYKGSLEERAQEAIIIFREGNEERSARQDMILKIEVHGNVEEFAWIIPFPSKPDVEKEDAKLFAELFRYVESRRRRTPSKGAAKDGDTAALADNKAEGVRVLSREVVGEFDVAVVEENEQGGLNPWLEKEGFQQLENADDVIEFYRKKKYVFACIKVSRDSKSKSASFESHPLRFTFDTKGRDGIYFPMKLTGLQKDRFDVNLYIFYRYWLNDKLSPFGYNHRGFRLKYRDWDTSRCVPNGGKAYSLPETDPFLKTSARRLPLTTKLFQKLHPGRKFYLTNISARQLRPEDVRQWRDDLWMFPYYTDRTMVPYDARSGGPAANLYEGVDVSVSEPRARRSFSFPAIPTWAVAGGAALLCLIGIAATSMARRRPIDAKTQRVKL